MKDEFDRCLSTPHNILLAVPSHKRPNTVPTLELFPQAVLFIPESQYDEYREAQPRATIVTHSDKIRGLTPKLNWMLNWAKDKGYDAMVKIDDDFEQPYWVGGYVEKVTNLEMIMKFQILTQMCLDSDTNLFTFMPTADARKFEVNRPFKLFSSIKISIYGVILKDRDVQYFDERFVLKQDIDYAFQTVYKYRHFWVDWRYSFMYAKTGGNVGGCADYRTTELEQEMIKLLRKKWGERAFEPGTSRRSKGFTIRAKNPLFEV